METTIKILTKVAKYTAYISTTLILYMLYIIFIKEWLMVNLDRIDIVKDIASNFAGLITMIGGSFTHDNTVLYYIGEIFKVEFGIMFLFLPLYLIWYVIKGTHNLSIKISKIGTNL